MPLVKRYTFQVNQKALSSQVNANFDDIITAYNAHSHTNIGTDVSLITSSGIAPGAIGATALSTGAITLGYAQITSNFSTSSVSEVQVTGVTTTVTVPNGARRVFIMAFCGDVLNASSTQTYFTIWRGSAGSGTQLNQSKMSGGGLENPLSVFASEVPVAGSQTYNLGMHVGTGTGTANAGSTNPTFILVQAI